MCNSLNLIQTVANEFVNLDKAFTAFEVSLEVQERLRQSGSPVERHRDMKDDIHRCLQGFVDTGVYQKNLQDVGAPSKAFLYYPPSFDPTTYVGLDRKDNNAQTKDAVGPSALRQFGLATMGISVVSDTNGVQVAVADDDGDDGDEQIVGRTGDARGTVTVPNYILRAASFNQNDVAYVSATTRNGEAVLILAKQIPSGLSKLTSYTVDHANNIRITQYTLEKAGLDGTNGYDFERDGEQVVVKGHVAQN